MVLKSNLESNCFYQTRASAPPFAARVSEKLPGIRLQVLSRTEYLDLARVEGGELTLAAGSREVVLDSADRLAILVEHRGPETELPAVLARLAPVDLVLVEGYKRDAHPKIEVWREETGQPLIQTGDPLVRAVATDAALTLPVPVLDLNDTRAVADFILREVWLV